MVLDTKLAGREQKMMLRDDLVEVIIRIIDERIRAISEGKIPNSDESSRALKDTLNDLFDLYECDWEVL